MNHRSFYIFFFLLAFFFHSYAQQMDSVTVTAGKQYERTGFQEWLWGKHYRKEWTTPVKLPVFNIDTTAGGLTPVEQGGGRQTKTLRLVDKKGKQYVLRTIDKSYTGALPPELSGTFIEDIANDQVSTAHPFAALTVPGMISAAGIYHTKPVVVFVPYSPTLGKYNEIFANTICLFEERADEDQSDAPHFGNSKNVVGTAKMLENTREKNHHRVDQHAYVRARLFDIFLGDWGRHEDQWRWATFDSAGAKIYKPIPRDRDQAFAKFDGVLVKLAFSLADLDHLQTFEHTIKDIETYNFPARNLDRRHTNQLGKSDWLSAAAELQRLLTDSVITASVKKLPPEIFAISGNEIIGKLKSRRNDLQRYANDYYDFITKEVEVPGSEGAEFFSIHRQDKDHTLVQVYDMDDEGMKASAPFYSRTFHTSETKEIRLYGLKGKDQYLVEGRDNGMKVRIIGGIDRDSVVNTGEGKGISYFDNPGNYVSGDLRKNISGDTAINSYKYNGYQYSSGGLLIRPSYSNRRGIYFSLGYKREQQHWRKEPFGWKQLAKVYYSFTNNSLGGDYEGIFTTRSGKWNFLLNGSYDHVLDNYFLGIGNETKFNDEKVFFKLFTREASFITDINRKLAAAHETGIRFTYDMVKVLKEGGKFYQTIITSSENPVYDAQHFAGAELYYNWQVFNDAIVPTKGFRLYVTGNHVENLGNDKSYNRYTGLVGFYIPFGKSISLATRTGAATVKGQPEFYQLNTLGGGQTLRGYFRQRFYGKTSLYNNTDLRWIFDFRSKLFNGKMGFIAFADHGRIWHPGESSDKWHAGYGGGLLIAPFNKISLTVYYGTSPELGKFHFRIGRFL